MHGSTTTTTATVLGDATPRMSAATVVDAVKVHGKGDGQVRALDRVSVDFHAGEFTTIMGPSGSGKSTLMHCVAGLDYVDEGTIRIGDCDLTALNDRQLTQLRRDRIGFVFQAFNLVPTLTARENIELPARLAGRRGAGFLVRPRHRDGWTR